MSDAISPHISPGFADPVGAAQTTFRAVLTALSEPGRIMTLDLALEPPRPLGLASGALALSLLDGDTPLWCDPAARTAIPSLRFHTGAPVVEAPERALFALVADVAALPSLATFDAGSDEYPDHSATVLLAVEALGAGETLTLRGPGIPETRALAVTGLPAGFRAEWRANHARFPRGIDVILTCGNRLAGLPRSVQIVEER
ncbi:MAG: phosphonate C-P lyase system protein PhnH [Alphaproteobacteria bacterium]|nr:phosphonate C-P lyase system protein PhnH [Alphaproteobacteria bacterium]